MQTVTRVLARYVVSSRLEDLPQLIQHEGVRAFVNWVGCAAGGCHEQNVEHVLELLLQFTGAREATLIGRHERLDALNAAFINAMSSAALSFNDTHFSTVAHPTSPVAGALFALAERQPVSGKAFLHALVLGIETQCRIANILCVAPAECGVGLSMAGLVGGIGAAVAAGKVLKLDEGGIATAIGHAANQAGGLRESHGTMASQFTPGHTARCGLMAALLAARGYTCSDTMIEGVKGFGVSYSQRPNFDAAVQGLGENFEIAALAYKPYPCGFVIHPAIDACLDIARNHAYDLAQIERVELAVNPLAVQLTDRPEPRNRNQTTVSLQHWAAVSLLQKAAGTAQMAQSVIHDPAVRALRAKIVLTPDPAVSREGARLRVVLKDGRSLEANVAHCRGSSGRPLTDAEVSEKALAQLQIAYAEGAAEELLAKCWRVAEYARVDELCAILATAPMKT
ncbi:MAG TPA: MmgE/PrpD family protein [Burkholderiales bacterium]|nr:MmgE/PrpD family protein [Burkholderiales bacterium]